MNTHEGERPTPPKRILEKPTPEYVEEQLNRFRNGEQLPQQGLSQAGQAEADSRALLQQLNRRGRELHDPKK